MPNEIFSLETYEAYSFDSIDSLILHTQKFKTEIINEWDKFIRFVKKNPTIEYRDEFGNLANNNFKILELKNEYIIDSYAKIFNQIFNYSPKIRYQSETIKIFFYCYEPEIYDYWQETNIPIGEIDENGLLNSNSCTVLKYYEIDWNKYITCYQQKCN